MCYKDRLGLKYLEMPTLTYRRARGDTIELEVYKLLTLKYDRNAALSLGLSHNTRTRGNALKLETIRAKYVKRKHSF